MLRDDSNFPPRLATLALAWLNQRRGVNLFESRGQWTFQWDLGHRAVVASGTSVESAIVAAIRVVEGENLCHDCREPRPICRCEVDGG